MPCLGWLFTDPPGERKRWDHTDIGIRDVYRYLLRWKVRIAEAWIEASGERLEKSNVHGTGVCVVLLGSLFEAKTFTILSTSWQRTRK